MPRVTLRPAVPADIPLILELITELADYERLVHEVKADAQRMHDHLFGPRPYAEVLIGEVDGEPQGFALFFHNYSTWLSQPGIYLEDLFVRPASRGAGLGKALLTELARLAVERGCGRLEWSVLDWNEPAIGFYESLGARPQDEWTVYRLTGDALRDLAHKG
ncbi:GNAT family N-acetyltransferase [Pseudomonas sp. SCB32]|uniref:GNAT family N-acetyltransferase n=1 Tax=Pseudomonas sp. SCB32 TaxID=2653853 RepID=UPI001265A5D9|nr:GNAT family N-acetyltransferase [Pseudomonas sp. SCB32]